MEQKIKNALPNLNINNYSNRSFEELMKIIGLCHKLDTILVFIERNEKNDDYFKMIETTQNSKEINLIRVIPKFKIGTRRNELKKTKRKKSLVNKNFTPGIT